MVATAVGSALESGSLAAGEVRPWVQAFGIEKTWFYSFQVAEFRQAAFFANEYQDIIW
jgi:hypothetical protein